jgi:preprotein translocase subunit YajC
MWDWRSIGRLLADDVPEAVNDAAGNGAGGDGGGSGIWPMLMVFGPALIIFMLINALLGGPDRKEKARRQQLLSTLKKNDQIVTIGGILGTVVSVSDDKSSVTIRVDDNSRIKFRLDAIREVVSRPGEETTKES